MTLTHVGKLLYRSSNIDEKRFEKILRQPLPFDNCEYELRITGTVETDRRIMSFINTLWGFEVTGGSDQFEPLTVIDVNRAGYARRAGIRVTDRIIRINNVYTDDLTLTEAQVLIRKSGKQVQIFVQGDSEPDPDDEYTVDFWFKPRRFPIIKVENKWKRGFPWNDRKKAIYKESNCFMVPSKAEEQRTIQKLVEKKEPVIVTVSDDNVTSTYDDQPNQNGTTNGENGVSNGHQTAADGQNVANGVEKPQNGADDATNGDERQI